mgnify:CR=1 FL=1
MAEPTAEPEKVIGTIRSRTHPVQCATSRSSVAGSPEK